MGYTVWADSSSMCHGHWAVRFRQRTTYRPTAVRGRLSAKALIMITSASRQPMAAIGASHLMRDGAPRCGAERPETSEMARLQRWSHLQRVLGKPRASLPVAATGV